MGIIIRQSIKQSVVAFVALIVAAGAQFFIYTLDDSTTYGAARRIIDIAMLIYPILLFGIPQALIKFYEKYRDSGQGYLGNFLLLTFSIYSIFIGFCWLFRDTVFGIFDRLGFDVVLLESYAPQLVILILVLMIFKVLASHMANHKRIVWPGIFDGLWTKIALAGVVFLIIKGYVSFHLLSWGVVAYYVMALLALIIYSWYLGKLDLRYNPKVFGEGGFKEISKYSAYAGLTVFGATFATRIDSFMVAGFTNDQLAGVYALFLFLASVVDIPTRAVNQISGPIIAQANERGDIAEVQDIYSKAARTLFLIGTSIFALIALSVDDLFALTGRGGFYGEYIILFIVLGLIKVIPATFSSAAQILVYSKYYKLTLYITLTLGVVNVLLNYYFITTIYQDTPLTGVCIASAISIGLQYFLMVLFVWIKFRIHPLHYKLLVTAFIVLICYALAFFIPATSIDLVNIILKSMVFLIPFSYLIYTFRISEDVNSLIDQLITRIKNRDFKNLI